MTGPIPIDGERPRRRRVESLRGSYAQLKDSVAQVRGAARDSLDELRATVARARADARAAGESLGLSPDDSPVIDVGPKPGLLREASRAAVAVVALALLVGGVVALGSFLFQFALAVFLLSQVLGLRVDLAPQAARS